MKNSFILLLLLLPSSSALSMTPANPVDTTHDELGSEHSRKALPEIDEAPTKTAQAEQCSLVTLESDDGQKFSLSREIANCSVTLKNIFQDLDKENPASIDPLPLRGISADTLRIIVECLEKCYPLIVRNDFKIGSILKPLFDKVQGKDDLARALIFLDIPFLHTKFQEYLQEARTRSVKLAKYNKELQIISDPKSLNALAIADANYKFSNGSPIINLAAKFGQIDAVNILLNHRIDPMNTDRKKRTALHIAAANGYVDIVDALCKKGFNVNCTCLTPNKYHCKSCSTDVCWMTMTPLWLALLNCHKKVFSLLIKKGARIESGFTLCTHGLKLSRQCYSKLKSSLHGTQIIYFDSMLHVALLKNFSGIVEELLKLPDVKENAKTMLAYTMAIAGDNYLDALKLLILSLENTHYCEDWITNDEYYSTFELLRETFDLARVHDRLKATNLIVTYFRPELVKNLSLLSSLSLPRIDNLMYNLERLGYSFQGEINNILKEAETMSLSEIVNLIYNLKHLGHSFQGEINNILEGPIRRFPCGKEAETMSLPKIANLMYELERLGYSFQREEINNILEGPIRRFPCDKEKETINKPIDSAGNTLLHWATRQNLPLLVLKLLIHGADISIVNTYGENPVHIAYQNCGGPSRHYVAELFKVIANSSTERPGKRSKKIRKKEIVSCSVM